jgi:hypothetical protein
LVTTTSRSTNPAETTMSATKKITFGGVEIWYCYHQADYSNYRSFVMHRKEDQKKLSEDKLSPLFENMVKQVLPYKHEIMSY